jgi:hypothetical protein
MDDVLDRHKDYPATRRRDHSYHCIHKAPQGGLIIHWFMSAVVIAGTAGIASTLESISVPGYLQTYVHCFMLCRSSSRAAGNQSNPLTDNFAT